MPGRRFRRPSARGPLIGNPVTQGKATTIIFDNKVEQATNFDREQTSILSGLGLSALPANIPRSSASRPF